MQNQFTLLALMDKISEAQKRLLEKNDEFTRIMLFLNRLTLSFVDSHEKESKEIKDILQQATSFSQSAGIQEIASNAKYMDTMSKLGKVTDDKVNPKALHGALKALYGLFQESYEDTEGFATSLKAALTHPSPTVGGYQMVYSMASPGYAPMYQPAHTVFTVPAVPLISASSPMPSVQPKLITTVSFCSEIPPPQSA